MMMPTHKVRILATTQPVEFRKGHDGLAALVQSILNPAYSSKSAWKVACA